MKTLFSLFTIFIVVIVAAAVFTFADEDWFPETWRDLAHHQQLYNAKHASLEAVRKLRNLGPRTVLDVLKADPAECKSCFVLADIIIAAVRSPTGDKIIDGLLDDVCQKHFANSTKDDALCKDIVKVLTELLGKGLNELVGDLHFNVSAMLCADALNLCIEPCCSVSRPYQPEQRRLAFSNSHGIGPVVNMTVTWMTLAETQNDYVEYTVSNEYSKNETFKSSLNARTTTYHFGGNVGYTHGVMMPNLPQNSSVTYRVGSSRGMSDWATFKTLPVNAGTVGARPLRFALVADMGTHNSQNTVARIIEKIDGLDGLILPGDSDGYSDLDERVENIWGRLIDPIVSRIPYIVQVGNHEKFAIGNIGQLFAYTNRYATWNPPAGSGAPSDALYYHLNLGPLNLMMLDSETVINTADIDAAQREWMLPKLQECNAQPGTFLAVMHHRPLYCSNNYADCVMFSALLREQVEKHYLDNGVDLIQSGHLHSYQRTLPTFNNSVAGNGSYFFPSAPISVINGLPGNKEPISTFERKDAWSAFEYNQDYVYQIVEFSQSVIGDGKVHTTMSSTTYRSVDDSIVDQFAITSKR